MRRILLLLILITMVLPFPSALASNKNVITININSDLAAALDAVANNGTIYIDGRYNIPKDFVWENHEKTVTITGGILSFTKQKDFFIGDNVRFEDIRLQFADNSSLYANGFNLYIHDNVTVSGAVTLYGGSKIKDVACTNMTLMGGTFFNVYGGGNGGDVLGDVNLTVGGNFNKKLQISHAHDHQIFGGGNISTVQGNVNLTFCGNARANYVYGGCSGNNSKINGHIKLNFTGGKAMSICGGSSNVNQQCDVYLFFSGGEVQQIFGGCEKSSMSGNILLYITGGKVTRRIYGGCYNNYTSNGWQKSPNYVYGEILLLLGENANPVLNYGNGDETLFAHSRQETHPKTESAHIAFTSAAAEKKLKNKIGPQDGTMKYILGDAKPCDSQHILTYSVSDDTIIQSCNKHDAATATVSVSNGMYTGEPVENATVTVTENWLGPVPLIEYSDNISVGMAEAKITMGDTTLTVSYFISPPVWIWITAGSALLLIAGGITTFIIIHKKRRKKAAT